MIYELTIDGYLLGVFSSEAEAVRRARYLPRADILSGSGRGTANFRRSTLW